MVQHARRPNVAHCKQRAQTPMQMVPQVTTTFVQIVGTSLCHHLLELPALDLRAPMGNVANCYQRVQTAMLTAMQPTLLFVALVILSKTCFQRVLVKPIHALMKNVATRQQQQQLHQLQQPRILNALLANLGVPAIHLL